MPLLIISLKPPCLILIANIFLFFLAHPERYIIHEKEGLIHVIFVKLNERGMKYLFRMDLLAMIFE